MMWVTRVPDILQLLGLGLLLFVVSWLGWKLFRAYAWFKTWSKKR